MARRMAILVVLVAALVTFGCGEKAGSGGSPGGPSGEPSGGSSVKETIVAMLPPEVPLQALQVSGDLNRVIYVARRGKKEVVVLDGKESRQYDKVLAAAEDWWYAYYGTNEYGVPANLVGPIATEFRFAFSPDSRHVAYAAKDGNNRFVVADGQEGGRYDNIERIIYSPDSGHLAYVAKKGGSAILVVDGKERPPAGRVEDFRFSEDGTVKWVAIDDHAITFTDGEKVLWKYTGEGLTARQLELYNDELQAWNLKQSRAAWVEMLGKGERAVVDGVAGKQYNHVGSIKFSPDGKRIAYVGGLPRVEGTEIYPAVMVVDGVEGPKYAKVGTAVFSPDGRHVAYLAKATGDPQRGEECMIVLDGVESPRYSDATSPVFSRDSEHYAYRAQSQGKAAVYVDGKGGKTYEGVSGPTFSPDGAHVAYSATGGGRQWVVLDGKDGRAYYTVENITFSPDSKRLAYLAQVGADKFVVVDGKQGEPYNEVGGFAWSPDSKRYAYRANIPPDWVLYVDGRKAYTASEWLTPLAFDSDGVIRFVATRGRGEFVKVEVTPK